LRGDRAIEVLDSERGGLIAIGVLVAASIALSLWLTRGTTFFVDELWYYDAYRGFNLQELLTQHNGHLVLIPRLIYATGFKLFGSDYFFFRLVQAVGIGLVGWLAYFIARPRVGGALALATAAPLLFLGCAWDATLSSVGIPAVWSLVFGLGAILAVRVESRRGDALTCLLLALAVATFSVGLAFAVGIAVAVLMRPQGWRRAWVFAVPLLLWAAWKIGKPGLEGPLFGDSPLTLSNALFIPAYAASSAASLLSGITGLSYDFGGTGFLGPPASVDGPWGPPLAALVLLAIVLRFRRSWPPATFWPLAGALLALWTSFALSSGFIARGPDASRYVLPAAAIALPMLAEAAGGLRFTRRAVLVVLALVVLSLASNISQLRSAGHYLRDNAVNTRADFGAEQLARNQVGPTYAPGVGRLATPLLAYATQADRYLPAADRIGPIGYSPAQIAAIPELARREADQVLAEALGVHLSKGQAPVKGARCRSADPGAEVRLPPGGARLRSATPSAVQLRRFADTASAPAGRLSAGANEQLTIPTDESTRPWFATFDPAAAVRVCPL
jgi:hypothetical protein